MKVLVINAGSSSLKFTMFRMANRHMLAKGLVERIGLAKPRLIYEREDGTKTQEEAPITNHDEALNLVCDKLVDPRCGVLESLSEVEAVGHRVVHGGERFTASVIVDNAVKHMIQLCAALAPLHNPPNLGGIEACEKAFPDTPNIAVFDTAFHQTMPPSSYLYAVPLELYEEYGIRKYGFHGSSHKFITLATCRFLGMDCADTKLITCHLGNGSSVAAVAGGKVVDTSMGLTPLMGLVMGTRCGDLDPGIVLYLLKQGKTADQIDTILNKQSGLLGIGGIGSSDMRDILAATEDGHKHATQALDIFVHRLVSYIGSYYTLLDGAHAVVFTGGIGENCVPVRKRVIDRLKILGCKLDEAANAAVKGEAVISTPDSTLKAVVMPTNEELMIALETERVMQTGANSPKHLNERPKGS